MGWKAVLFDLDGTLLDTLADLADAMNRVLNRHGFPTHDYESYQYLIGNGMKNLVRRSLPAEPFSEETVVTYLNQLRAEYQDHWRDQTKPYPGINELLDFLEQSQMRLAVLSNKADDFTKEMIATLIPRGRFAAVEGAKPEMPLKPDPAGALAIAVGMGLTPADFLYLGDSGVDMQTARAAGMYPVGVLWGFRKADELLAAGAAKLIKQPAELRDLLVQSDVIESRG